jgi:hypothetical protein
MIETICRLNCKAFRGIVNCFCSVFNYSISLCVFVCLLASVCVARTIRFRNRCPPSTLRSRSNTAASAGKRQRTINTQYRQDVTMSLLFFFFFFFCSGCGVTVGYYRDGLSLEGRSTVWIRFSVRINVSICCCPRIIIGVPGHNSIAYGGDTGALYRTVDGDIAVEVCFDAR